MSSASVASQLAAIKVVKSLTSNFMQMYANVRDASEVADWSLTFLLPHSSWLVSSIHSRSYSMGAFNWLVVSDSQRGLQRMSFSSTSKWGEFWKQVRVLTPLHFRHWNRGIEISSIPSGYQSIHCKFSSLPFTQQCKRHRTRQARMRRTGLAARRNDKSTWGLEECMLCSALALQQGSLKKRELCKKST